MRILVSVLSLLWLPSASLADSFDLIPTSSLFIGQGQMASFDVIYTADRGDEAVLAVNLRITYVHDSRPHMPPNSVVTISGNNNGNPFEIPTLNLMANSENMFLPQSVVDIGGSQETGERIDGLGGIKLGEISFGVEGPFMGNAGVITLVSSPAQTGARKRTFEPAVDRPSKLLAVIYVPEPTLPLLLLVGLVAVRRALG